MNNYLVKVSYSETDNREYSYLCNTGIAHGLSNGDYIKVPIDRGFGEIAQKTAIVKSVEPFTDELARTIKFTLKTVIRKCTEEEVSERKTRG